MAVASLLYWQLGVQDLHGIGHDRRLQCAAELPKFHHGVEFGGSPLLCDQFTAEVGAPAHHPVAAGLAHVPALQVPGVAVKHPVLGLSILLVRHRS